MQSLRMVLVFAGGLALGPIMVAQADPPATSAAPAAHPAAAAATTQSQAQMSAADVSEDRYLREQGYKPEMRKGQRYYCRREARLGSRFEETACLTAEQSRDMRQHSKEIIEHAQRNSSTPAKP